MISSLPFSFWFVRLFFSLPSPEFLLIMVPPFAAFIPGALSLFASVTLFFVFFFDCFPSFLFACLSSLHYSSGRALPPNARPFRWCASS